MDAMSVRSGFVQGVAGPRSTLAPLAPTDRLAVGCSVFRTSCGMISA